ncbi:MAG: putative membrane protein, partial [Sphingobacteriales bacterium]
MYTRKVFKIKEVFLWTRYDTLFFAAYISALVAVYFFLDLSWLQIPWTAIALIGTAVSFLIGFQNNSVYGRIWEARKIWGGIVNTSRTFGVWTQDMLTNERTKTKLTEEEIKNEVKILTYRHIAWMTALRYSMRSPRPWEITNELKTNNVWTNAVPEKNTPFDEAIAPYLSKEDLAYIKSKGNAQTATLYLQSHHLRKLKESGLIWEFAFLELEGLIKEMFEFQGKSERIKNFPFPRQYATINHYFMWLLLLILPTAMIPQFQEIGTNIAEVQPLFGKLFVWLAVPFYTAVAWMFHT